MQMLIVVVRYNVALDEAETIAGLSRAFAEHPELGERIGTLIWDKLGGVVGPGHGNPRFIVS